MLLPAILRQTLTLLHDLCFCRDLQIDVITSHLFQELSPVHQFEQFCDTLRDLKELKFPKHKPFGISNRFLISISVNTCLGCNAQCTVSCLSGHPMQPFQFSWSPEYYLLCQTWPRCPNTLIAWKELTQSFDFINAPISLFPVISLTSSWLQSRAWR